MLKLRTSGYRSQSLASDISLGIFDGLDNALWCYAFATVIFAGALAPFMPLLVAILLCGWALLTLFVALTSARPIHVVSLDEQAVVILSAVAGLMVVHMGGEAVSPRGLSTILAVMALSSVAVAVCFWVIGRFRLTRLLQLMPYPVICGFMAGIAWLLLEAGVRVAVGSPVSELATALKDSQNVTRLLLFVAAAAFMLIAITRMRRAWALPLASLVLLFLFYAVVWIKGFSGEELVARGWLFDIPPDSGALTLLQGLSLDRIDTAFVVSVLPEILTIAFLALLTQSMSLSALVAADDHDLDTSQEIEDIGKGNLLCAMVASPPGSTDVITSMLYREFGASSRWMPLVTAAVCLLMAAAGSAVIAWMPKLLVGATVLLFAWQLFYEWTIENVKGFQPFDFAIVLIILGTVIFAGFMPGILVGILLALLLFVLRYSMISAIQGHYTIDRYRSSVERSPADNDVLEKHGVEAAVYALRGFLFFGTANAVLDTIRDDERGREGRQRMVLLDFERVTGMDISALNTFAQIRTACEFAQITLLYSGVSLDIRENLVTLGAVNTDHGEPLIFKDADHAIEYMEESLLTEYDGSGERLTVSQHLQRILGERHKAELLARHMDRVEVREKEILFEQGAEDCGLYILEQGTMTALIRSGRAGYRRVKKFRPGALIGEMSAYSNDRRRSATLVADEDSVLYHLSAERIASLDQDNLELVAAIHELVARTLGMRVDYMNKRLFQDM